MATEPLNQNDKEGMTVAGKYDRTIKAALSETQSKFALAEALALDIPERARGESITANGKKTVSECLIEVRIKIIEAGGEEKTIPALDLYRRTALWVKYDRIDVIEFRWQKASFFAHTTAMSQSLPFEEFESMPVKTGDAITKHARELRGGRAARGGESREHIITCSQCGEPTGMTAASNTSASNMSRTARCLECANPEHAGSTQGPELESVPDTQAELEWPSSRRGTQQRQEQRRQHQELTDSETVIDKQEQERQRASRQGHNRAMERIRTRNEQALPGAGVALHLKEALAPLGVILQRDLLQHIKTNDKELENVIKGADIVIIRAQKIIDQARNMQKENEK